MNRKKVRKLLLTVTRQVCAGFLAFLMAFSPVLPAVTPSLSAGRSLGEGWSRGEGWVFPFMDQLFFAMRDLENLASYTFSQVKSNIASTTNPHRELAVWPDFETPDQFEI